MNRTREQLMHIIEVSSFALDDLVLFLDSHPDCTEALELYNQQKAIRHQAIREYTDLYGPIDKYDVNTCQGWSWTATPWPWEGEC